MSFTKLALFITVLFLGLIAGLLYAYSCSVNPGLKTLPDSGYLKAMQSINDAIQNPLFFISFMGLLILLPVTNIMVYKLQTQVSYLLIAALGFYYIGVIGVTIVGNVPLNNQLAKFAIATATDSEIHQMRVIFEKPWNTFHTIRTISSIISFGLGVLYILKQKI